MKRALQLGILFVLVLAVFAPVRKFEFLNWDDPNLLLERPWYYPLRAQSIVEMVRPWNRGEAEEYAPLRDLTYAADLRIWGWSAPAFHTSQAAVHALNACLLALVLGCFVAWPYALAGGLLWGVHPIAVEPVAWISARKDVLLATCTFLLLLFLVRAAWKRAAAFGVGAMLCKATGVGAGLCGLSVLGLLENRRAAFRTCLGLVLAGGAFAVFLFLDRAHQAVSVAAASPSPLTEAWPSGLQVVPFALSKIFWPAHLSARYVQNPALGGSDPLIWGGGVLGLLWLALALVPTRRFRVSQAGLFFAAAAFAPYLVIVPRNVWMGDRYLYLSAAGFVWAFVALPSALSPKWRKAFLAAPLLLISVSVLLTRERLPVWKDSLSLWEDTARKSPSLYYVWTNLGSAQFERGRLPDALRSYGEAFRLNPREPLPLLKAAQILIRLGKPVQAGEELRRFEAILSPSPRERDLRDRAIVWAELGNAARSEPLFREYLDRNPRDPVGWSNYGIFLARSGREPRALEAWARALVLNSEEKHARMNRARYFFLHRRCPAMREDLAAIRAWDDGEVGERDRMLSGCVSPP